MAPRPRSVLVPILALAMSLGPIPIAFSGPSPAAARLTGRIFEPDLVTPATDLTVQAYPEGAKTPVAVCKTDHRGRFDIEDLPAGPYVLLMWRNSDAPLAAARVDVPAGSRRIVALALPDPPPEGTPPAAGQPPAEGKPPAEGQPPASPTKPAAPPKKKGGLLKWMSTPVGATVVLVAAAAVLAVAADELTKKETVPELPPSPTAPQ